MSNRFACIAASGVVLAATACIFADTRPGTKIVVHRDLVYREGDCENWKLDLAVPETNGDKLRPAIVVIHGGGWVEGDKSSFTTRKDGTPGNIEDFAECGFVAATINYRLSGEAAFPAAVEDCKCAVRWLRAHAKEYRIDPEHIGAWGNSAGGHLALMLGMTYKSSGLEGDGPYQSESSRVQAVVSDSGPIDLIGLYKLDRIKKVVRKFMDGPPEGDREAKYRQASPSSLIKEDTPPLLLLYGADDELVPIASADRFVADLGRAGLKDVSYYRLAKVGHCPHSLIRVPYLKEVVNEFFHRTLAPSESNP
jgi:acetyl esterase/lipase